MSFLRLSPISWKKVFQAKLSDEFKVSVSIGTDSNGQVISSACHLQSYFIDQDTADCITLKAADLDTISRNEYGNFTAEFLDHSISCSIRRDSAQIQVSNGNQVESIGIPIFVYGKLYDMSRALKFILSCSSRMNKKQVASDLVKMLLIYIRRKPMGKFADNLFNEMFEKVKSLIVEFLCLTAKPLGVKIDDAVAILKAKTFPKNALSYIGSGEADKNGYNNIIPILLRNEFSEDFPVKWFH